MISFSLHCLMSFYKRFHPSKHHYNQERKYHHHKMSPGRQPLPPWAQATTDLNSTAINVLPLSAINGIRVWTHTASLTSIRLSVCPSAVRSVNCSILSHYMPITACLPVLLLQTTELFLMFWLLGIGPL